MAKRPAATPAAGALAVEQWPTDRLQCYARNPRKNDHAVDRMCAAITEFGFRIPIVARSTGEVVDGHLRLKAARKLGLASVPVALADELSDSQVKAFRLLANQSANWAKWDNDLLKIELGELRGLDFNLELTGFDAGEIDGLFGEPKPDDDGPAQGAGAYQEQYGCIVMCKDERQQREIYERLRGEGYEVKVVAT